MSAVRRWRGSCTPVDVDRAEVVDAVEADQQSQKPPVPRPVKVVARDEQQPVLRRCGSTRYSAYTTRKKARKWKELKTTGASAADLIRA